MSVPDKQPREAQGCWGAQLRMGPQKLCFLSHAFSWLFSANDCLLLVHIVSAEDSLRLSGFHPYNGSNLISLRQWLSTCRLKPLWGLHIRYLTYQIFVLRFLMVVKVMKLATKQWLGVSATWGTVLNGQSLGRLRSTALVSLSVHAWGTNERKNMTPLSIYHLINWVRNVKADSGTCFPREPWDNRETYRDDPQQWLLWAV